MENKYPAHNARTVDIEDDSSDIRIIRLEIENKTRLSFRPGQYVFLEVPGLEGRAFSIASTPDEQHLEFHVRNSGHGISAHITGDLHLGDALLVKGPFGKNTWQESDRPVLALAGGLGIAPVKSIIQAGLRSRQASPIHLYWGVRDENHLYLDPFFRDLTQKNKRFSYIPVLQENTSGRFRQGLIHEPVLEDFDDLEGHDIYMAGPMGMIDAMIPQLLNHGAEKDRIFCDTFSL